jgi:hypothetical protein
MIIILALVVFFSHGHVGDVHEHVPRAGGDAQRQRPVQPHLLQRTDVQAAPGAPKQRVRHRNL